jgi:hypothetical protein
MKELNPIVILVIEEPFGGEDVDEACILNVEEIYIDHVARYRSCGYIDKI